MTTAEHVKIVNDVSLSQRPTLPAARDKARASSASRDLFLVLCAYCILYPVVSNLCYSIPNTQLPDLDYRLWFAARFPLCV